MEDVPMMAIGLSPLEYEEDRVAIRSPETRLSEADGLIDWGVLISEPPPRPRQSLIVRMLDGGKRPIRIEDDPQD